MHPRCPCWQNYQHTTTRKCDHSKYDWKDNTQTCCNCQTIVMTKSLPTSPAHSWVVTGALGKKKTFSFLKNSNWCSFAAFMLALYLFGLIFIKISFHNCTLHKMYDKNYLCRSIKGDALCAEKQTSGYSETFVRLWNMGTYADTHVG